MFDQLDPRSPTPLYDQIASRIRVAIAAGDIRPNEPLPSVRRLAARLRVNPATAVQAYRQLEAEGFVEMRRGAGTYARDVGADLKTRERSQHAVRLVRAMLQDAARLGLDPSDLIQAFNNEVNGGT